jgi:hypothetical protein
MFLAFLHIATEATPMQRQAGALTTTLMTTLMASLVCGLFAAESLAAGTKIDFDGDGFEDLAVGAPDATVNGKQQAGSVTVIYGTSSGLSSAYSELWTKDLASVPGDATAGDFFGFALEAADFNGDGFSDLAIGVPGWNSSAPPVPGAVIVLHGSSTGLKGYLTWCPCPPPPKVFAMATPQTTDRFGMALAAADFNMDGYADLAIGAPNYALYIGGTTVPAAGAVRVLYGGSTGLTTTGSKVLSLATSGMSGAPYAGDHFGDALAAADFGKAYFADLAIGIPGRYADGRPSAGAVSVVYGTIGGLSPIEPPGPFGGGGNTLWAQDNTLFPGSASNDKFGKSLAAGNFNGGSFDLAIGIPGKKVGSLYGAGAVTILYGGSNGLSNTGSQQWSLASSGVVGAAEAYGNFGAAVAAGNMGRDTRDDLAIGVPNYTVGGVIEAGAVSVLFGTSTGLAATNSVLVHLDVNSQTEAHFGAAVAVAKLTVISPYASFADLVVGIPDWDLSSVLEDAGAVSIHAGWDTGPSATWTSWWTAEDVPVGGIAEARAEFGRALPK